MQAIPGTKSPLAWVGGKSNLVAKILPLAPPHICYVEAFAGAAWMLFKKPPSKVEVINDANSELTNLYRILQHHIDEFLRYFRWLLTAREEFDRFKVAKPETLTDVQRAVRFYYLLKMGHGGKVTSPCFGYGTTQGPRLNLMRIEEDLSQAHLRLSGVYVECLDWRSILKRYDRPHTWFYLDPPYYGSEGYYGKGLFEREHFKELRDQLAGLAGKWLLSINDVPEIRSIFKGFTIKPVQTTYSMGSAERGKAQKELLILNYRPPRQAV
jgi:DNA adenine methylase